MFFSQPPTSHPKIQPWPKTLNYDVQSLAVPGTKRPGQTHHYRSAIFDYINIEDPRGFQTLLDVFESGLKYSKDLPFLGQRQVTSKEPLTFANEYTWVTYSDIDVRRRNLGSAIHSLFRQGILEGENGLETVGIWAPNRPEWQVIDLASQAYNKVAVSLYDTLGSESVEYVINHSHLSIIFAEPHRLPALLKLSPKIPCLKAVVSIDDLSADTKHALTLWASERGIKVYTLKELESFGAQNLLKPIPVTHETIATICYTSGTTNNPKGVVLTHGHLASSVYSNLHGLDLPEGENSEMYSFLPLAHIYERVMELCTIGIGGKIGFSSGSPLRLMEDMQILKPNFFPAVPRILNRIYQSAMAAGNMPGLKGKLFNMAVETKLERLRTTGDHNHAFWDRVVFKKVQAALGGNVKFISCGSAPINAKVMNFLRIALACPIVEGDYGMTENCGTTVRILPNDPSSAGCVGVPQPVNEVKLIDVPGMGYTSEDKPYPRGEILVRGANCFSYYYKDEKNTKETVDAEGFIHTGDVGAIDEHGRFKIIDRVKNIMKLAQGEYVALEKVENLLSSCPIVAQIFVHGDSLQSYLLGVIVPDPVQLATLASKIQGKNIRPEDAAALEAAIKDPKVKAAILHMLTRDAITHGLKGFEIVKRIHVTLEQFCVENNTLTPTMKLRRKDAYLLHKQQLDALYDLGEPSSSGISPKL